MPYDIVKHIIIKQMGQLVIVPIYKMYHETVITNEPVNIYYRT